MQTKEQEFTSGALSYTSQLSTLRFILNDLELMWDTVILAILIGPKILSHKVSISKLNNIDLSLLQKMCMQR